MILTKLDNELGGLILKHKEINKSALALKYGVDRHSLFYFFSSSNVTHSTCEGRY